MTREAALIVMVVVAFALLALVLWGWRRRTRRDSALSAPVGEAPEGSVVLATFSGLYVATTVHDAPLERLAIDRLGFRSRVDVTVTDRGVALDLTGQPRIFLPADRIVGVGQATVAIDRVVERDGLARLSWRIDRTGDTAAPGADRGDTVVDSYFRPQTASARDLVDAVRPTLTPSTGGPA